MKKKVEDQVSNQRFIGMDWALYVHRQFGLPGCSPETKKGAKPILTKDLKNAEVNGSHEVSDARGRRDFDWIGPCE